MDNTFIDYFEILQVSLFAEEEIIKMAYRTLCKKYHPDNMNSNEKIHLINQAYQELSDKQKKKNYIEAWIRHYGDSNLLDENALNHSIYDVSLQPLRQIVLEYMYFIKNKEYELAYRMLSSYNRKKIFKKDYILWQSLIAYVHHLIDYDCTLSRIYALDETMIPYLKDRKIVEFKVKVIEENILLDRVEEDFFERKLIREDSGWYVLLNSIDIKEVIKKYRKIIAIASKQSKKMKEYFDKTNLQYQTGLVTKDTFLNICDYEEFRFRRYNHPYSLLNFSWEESIKSKQLSIMKAMMEYLKKSSRRLDVFSVIHKSKIIVLLPETDDTGAKMYKDKVLMSFKGEPIKDLNVTIVCSDMNFIGVKEMLSKVL